MDRRGLGWATAALAGLVLAVAPAAQAGTYGVYACKKPDGTAAPTEGWTGDGSPSVGTVVPCSEGKAMRASLPSSSGPGAFSRLAFTPPGGLPVVGFVIYRTASLGADYSYTLEAGGTTQETAAGPATVGQPTAPLGEGSVIVRGGLPPGQLKLTVSCTNPNGCAPGTPSAELELHRAVVQLEDNLDPVFTSTPSGTLVSGGVKAGVVAASFSASDQGGGVYQALVEVDGRIAAVGPVDENEGKCVRPFTSLRPCKTSASGTISLDTGSLLDGRHQVRLLVRDATGSNQIVYGPVEIETRNGNIERGPANGSGGGDGSKLRATVGGRRSLTLSQGRTAVIRGQLRNAAGRVVAGAEIDILGTALATGASPQLLGKATTRADGRFSFNVPRGPGRRIEVRYRAHVNDPGAADIVKLTVRVRSRLSLGAPDSVRPLRFFRLSGRVRGGHIPSSGVIVDVQVRDPRRGWTVAKTTRARRSGRFSVRFRFVLPSTRGTFRFRARTRGTADYPYSLGVSRVVRVRVR